MDLAVKRIYLSLVFPGIFVVIIWMVFLLDNSLNLDLYFYGVFPRKTSGLLGILFYPVIHGSLRHIIANSMPILVLGTALFYFYRELAFRVFIISYLLSGVLIWLGARPSYHIGASGLIYALASFLFLSGVLRRHIGLMAISLIIVFEYGSMVWGIFPLDEQISWEGHLMGMLVGLALAFVYRKDGPQREPLPWERTDIPDDDDPDVPWDDFEVEGPPKNLNN